jgi:hypothetical protein
MLKLNGSYSKKVPVPGQDYSSQSYHASLECELSDGLSAKQIQERIHQVFDLVRQSVENELTGACHDENTTEPERKPALSIEPEAENNAKENGNGRDNGEKATTKQVKFITDLAGRRGISLDDLQAEIRDAFHVRGIYDLTRKQASRLVDKLKAA